MVTGAAVVVAGAAVVVVVTGASVVVGTSGGSGIWVVRVAHKAKTTTLMMNFIFFIFRLIAWNSGETSEIICFSGFYSVFKSSRKARKLNRHYEQTQQQTFYLFKCLRIFCVFLETLKESLQFF